MVLSLCAIILLFSLLALLVVPARFYKKNSLLMQKFCLRMIFVEKFRKLYTLGLLMALIMAHYGAHDWPMVIRLPSLHTFCRY